MTTIYLFDLDGTLLHLNLPIKALNVLRERMFEYIIRHVDIPATRSIFGMYREALRTESFPATAIAKLRSMIDEVECKNCQSLKQNSDLVRAVGRLRRAGAKIGLVTTNGRRVVEQLMSEGHLNRADFDISITRDDVEEIKPSPEPLRKALYLIGATNNDEVFFVGDSHVDEESAISHNTNGSPRIIFRNVRTFALLSPK